MFTALLLLTVIVLAGVVVGVIQADEDVLGMSIFGVFVVGIFGWVLLGNIITLTEKSETVACNVLKDVNACHVSSGNVVLRTYTDVASCRYLQERTDVKMKKITGYNMYNNPTTTKWEIADER